MGGQDEDVGSTTAMCVMILLPSLVRFLMFWIRERKEYSVFRELLRVVPGLEARLMESPEDEVVRISDLVFSHCPDVAIETHRYFGRFRKAPMVPGQTTPKA